MNQNFTSLLAIYGAVLATIVFVWDIFKYFGDRPNLRVNAYRDIRAAALLSDSQTYPIVVLAMVNIGKEPLTVVASGFRLGTESDDNTITLPDADLPKELTQGQRHTTDVSPDDIAAYKILYAWVRDATGKVYRSKKHPL